MGVCECVCVCWGGGGGGGGGEKMHRGVLFGAVQARALKAGGSYSTRPRLTTTCTEIQTLRQDKVPKGSLAPTYHTCGMLAVCQHCNISVMALSWQDWTNMVSTGAREGEAVAISGRHSALYRSHFPIGSFDMGESSGQQSDVLLVSVCHGPCRACEDSTDRNESTIRVRTKAVDRWDSE